MSVKFHFLHRVQLPHRKRIKRLVATLFLLEKTAVKNLDIIFCNDAFLLEMNQQFLDHDYYTDIITFDMSEDAGGVVGEVYISVETARLNAKRYNVLINNELLRLVVHGSLHLCGYSDKKKQDKLLMSSKENEYLSLFETM